MNAAFTAKTTENISDLKQIFRAVSNIISEGIFKVDESGIELVAADPAMVGLVNIKVKAEYFEEFEVEQEVDVGLNIERFYKFLAQATNDDEVEISYGEGDKENIWLNELKVTDGFNIKAGQPYLNLTEEDIPSVDQLEHDNKFQLSTGEVKRFLKFVQNNGAVKIESKEDGLEIEVDDNDMDYSSITADFDINYEDFEEEHKSSFSIDYLFSQFDGRTLPSLVDQVNCYMGSDYPLKITWENENFAYEFVLAPRIEEEE